MQRSDLHVVTGAPGSGKTAILDLLDPGIRCIGEPAREVLAEQLAVGGPATHALDRGLFVALLLQRSIEKHGAAQRLGGPIVFDRGVPDCIAYAALMEVDPTPSLRASEVCRYRREVFLLEPWEEIYTTDDERTMSFADTFAFHAALVDAYERTGYALVVIPRGPVEDRAGFVRERLAVGAASDSS